MEFGDFVAVGDEDDAGTVDEETMLDDAGDVAKLARQRWRIGDAAEVAVEDVMAFIRIEGLSIFLTDDHGGAELLDFATDQRERERDHLDGHRESCRASGLACSSRRQ